MFTNEIKAELKAGHAIRISCDDSNILASVFTYSSLTNTVYCFSKGAGYFEHFKTLDEIADHIASFKNECGYHITVIDLFKCGGIEL